ncbi:MAG TPA: hypothetical protein VNX01_00280, partial [Bacteroidia bacterium]|nr:hypothetical protein [Bacteroidia bacterium]
DLSVHREQLPGSDLFFDPHNKNELIMMVDAVINGNISFNVNYNHEQAITTFARGFIDLF